MELDLGADATVPFWPSGSECLCRIDLPGYRSGAIGCLLNEERQGECLAMKNECNSGTWLVNDIDV